MSSASAGPRSSASQRRLSTGRLLVYRLLAPLLAGLVRLLWRSARWEVRGGEHARALVDAGQPVILCFWHRQLLAGMGYMHGLVSHGLKPCLLISPSVDGELATRVAHYFGFAVVRGSATRTGLRALRGMHRALAGEGASPVIPPDGPKGPPEVFKPGAVMLARIGGAPILPVGLHVHGGRSLRTWDRFVVPLPFTRITVVVGEIQEIPRELANEGSEDKAKELGALLTQLDRDARSAP